MIVDSKVIDVVWFGVEYGVFFVLCVVFMLFVVFCLLNLFCCC